MLITQSMLFESRVCMCVCVCVCVCSPESPTQVPHPAWPQPENIAVTFLQSGVCVCARARVCVDLCVRMCVRVRVVMLLCMLRMLGRGRRRIGESGKIIERLGQLGNGVGISVSGWAKCSVLER